MQRVNADECKKIIEALNTGAQLSFQQLKYILDTQLMEVTPNLVEHTIMFLGCDLSEQIEPPFTTQQDFIKQCEDAWYLCYCSGAREYFIAKKEIDLSYANIKLEKSAKYYVTLLQCLIVLGAKNKIMNFGSNFYWQSQRYPKLFLYQNWFRE